MNAQRRWLAMGLALGLAVNSAGCIATMSHSEEAVWGTLLHKHVVSEPLPFKSKAVAGTMSVVVPGTGHLYLGRIGLGVAYFIGNLLWPINILWTLPGGIQATIVENKVRTVEYYEFGARKNKIERLKRKGKLPPDFKTYEEAQPLLKD